MPFRRALGRALMVFNYVVIIDFIFFVVFLKEAGVVNIATDHDERLPFLDTIVEVVGCDAGLCVTVVILDGLLEHEAGLSAVVSHDARVNSGLTHTRARVVGMHSEQYARDFRAVLGTSESFQTHEFFEHLGCRQSVTLQVDYLGCIFQSNGQIISHSLLHL